MLSVYFGTDTIGVREAAFARMQTLGAADTQTVLIDADVYTSGIVKDAVGATSLFGDSTLYILDTPSADATFAGEVEEELSAIAASANMFVVIEGKLLAAAKKRYQAAAETVQEVAAATDKSFNTFALADALARKDKKTLWVLLQQARSADVATEPIIGILWWQLKSLRLANMTASASEAGMKDFPYNKAKRALSVFSPGELERLSHELLTIYHDGHAGRRDIDVALEKWMLTL